MTGLRGPASPRLRKVLRDMVGAPGRTALVVMSIAVGVFAVGMIAGTRTMLSEGVNRAYLAINPPSAVLRTADGFDAELVSVVEGMRSVAAAEGRRRVTVRLKEGPDLWRDLTLHAIPDYEAMTVRLVRPESGAWPPPDREILIERSAVGLMDAAPGATIVVKAPNGDERALRIAGLAYDPSREPAFIEGVPFGFVTTETLEWLGEPTDFNELNIVVAENRADRGHAQSVAEKVRDKVEGSGHTVLTTWVPEPGKHPIDTVLSSVMLLLGALGILALILSAFLVINTVSALLAQQTRQIGMMKAIGARRNQIVGMYLGLVLGFGGLALVVAVPLGLAGAMLLTDYLAGLINVDLPPFRPPLAVIGLQVAVALIVPVAAALGPVLAGTGVTVREAISDYGLGQGHFGTHRLDRALEGVRGLPRPVLLSIRNTFRRKGRLALTLATLSLAGAIFIAVFSVRASMGATLDNITEFWRYDVFAGFSRPYPVERVVEAAEAVGGVAKAEAWGFTPTRRVRADGSEGDTVFLFAPPAATELLDPTVVAGRWLHPADENAVVLNSHILVDEPDVAVGDTVTLDIKGRESPWVVVGVVRAPGPDPFVYVNYPYYSRVAREPGRVNSVLSVLEPAYATAQVEVAAALEAHFRDEGLRVESVVRIAQEVSEAESAFNILVALLLVMASLLAFVGGLGLMGTMSLSVLERTREIGVMRAIGASHQSVAQIVVVEGVVIGLVSWVFGIIGAWPLGRLLSDAVGDAFLRAPLAYTYSTGGAVGWLGLVIVLAVVASLIPAWRATRISVREVLAYEG